MARRAPALALLLAALGGCPAPAPDGDGPDLSIAQDLAAAAPRLLPGVGSEKVRIGQSYAELRAAYGKGTCLPDPSCKTPQGWALVTFPPAGLSAFLGTDANELDDSAEVLALWTQAPAVEAPVRVGATAAELQAALGPPDSDYGAVKSYGKGLSVTLGMDGRVASVAVFSPYAAQQAPPEMEPAKDPPQVTAEAGAWPRYQLDGEEIDVVDMHLHPGSFGALGKGIGQSLVSSVPPFLLPILPAFVSSVGSPYTKGVGMLSQARRFGFNHVGYLAVWAPATVGWYTNTDLSRLLYDGRNVRRPDGRPLAFGLASIYWSDLMDNPLVQQRCAALESFLRKQGDRIVGIKLAHTHQGVRLASSATDCVYALSAQYKKPVALHTGKTPTPGALDEPEAYDPRFLEEKVKAFPGATFLLMHVGQGDLRATASALELATTYRNVALELSALGRPTVLNERGELSMSMEPQFPAVLAEARRRGIVDKLIWASDGPQTPGFPASYRDRVVAEMKKQGFSKDEMKGVLGGNFYRIFGLN